MEAEALYRQLAALASTHPDLLASSEDGSVPTETLIWIGRLSALLAAAEMRMERISVAVASENLGRSALRREANAQTISATLYRALADAELRAPAAAQGAFIPVAAEFDAFQALGKVLAEAKSDLLIVDPYMDEIILTDFAPMADEGVTLRLLAMEGALKPSLEPAAKRWSAQYGPARPLSVRISPPKSLHDRLFIIDGQTSWILTQSIKDVAKKSPAAIQRSDQESAALKVDAFEELWAKAEVLV